MPSEDFLYVRSELVGRVEDLSGPGSVITVKVAISTQELADRGEVMGLTVERAFSGNLSEDLRQAGLGFLEDLCEIRRDPVGYKKKLERIRARNLKRRGVEVPPEKGLMSTDDFFRKADEWQKRLGPALDEGCRVIELERLFERNPPAPPAISGSEMSNGRWRPENVRLSELLPAEAINDLVPIMNRVQRRELDMAAARREIFAVLEPHSKALQDLQIDVPNFAFKLAYVARTPRGGPLGEMTLKEIE